MPVDIAIISSSAKVAYTSYYLMTNVRHYFFSIQEVIRTTAKNIQHIPSQSHFDCISKPAAEFS